MAQIIACRCFRQAIEIVLIVITAGAMLGGDLAGAPTTARPDFPATLRSVRTNVSIPVWVSASVAFDADGNLRPDHFSNGDRKRIEANRRRNPGPDCVVSTGRPFETNRQSKSLSDLVANSLAIVTGNVVGIEQGFFTGMPGVLLAVKVESRLKRFAAVDDDEFVFAFVGEGRIETTKGLTCASSLSAVPMPQIGDGILLFAYDNPIDIARSILHVDPRQQLVLERNGAIYTGSSLGSATGKTFDDIVWSVREHPQLLVVPVPDPPR